MSKFTKSFPPMKAAEVVNCLLLADEVGKQRPTCYDLPESGHSYGKSQGLDQEGAREVTMQWVTSEAPAPEPAKFDFRKFNAKYGHRSDYKQLLEQAKLVSRPPKKFVPGLKKQMVLPHQVIRGYTFGKPGNLTKPDSAGDVLRVNQDAADLHPYQKRRPKVNTGIGKVTHTKTSIQRIQMTQAAKAKQESTEKPWTMKKFGNVQPTMALPGTAAWKRVRMEEAKAAAAEAAVAAAAEEEAA